MTDPKQEKTTEIKRSMIAKNSAVVLCKIANWEGTDQTEYSAFLELNGRRVRLSRNICHPRDRQLAEADAAEYADHVKMVYRAVKDEVRDALACAL